MINDYSWVGILIGAISTIVVTTTVAFGLSYGSCSAKSEKMGMNYSWGMLQGCMIEHRPGQWIDINRYRVID